MKTPNDKLTFNAIRDTIRNVTCENDAKRALMLASIRMLDVENHYYACENCRNHYDNVNECCRDDDCDCDDYNCEYCDDIHERASKLFDDAIDVYTRERRKFVINQLSRF